MITGPGREQKMKKEHTIKPIFSAYKEFKEKNSVTDAEILQFNYPGNPDVYNPSIPFISDGMEVMACRVQKRNERDSFIAFFKKTGNKYEPIPDTPSLPLEDPFVTVINNEIVLGGVHVEWSGSRALFWQTKFYKGSSIYDLKHFADGPVHMKDIRLLELNDGRIAVCTRPQGKTILEKYGCIAKIGFTIVADLSSLTPDVIEAAPFIDDIFLPDEWGGVNQMYNLPDGSIGAIGHISYRTGIEYEGLLHYYCAAFKINPTNLETTPAVIICSRDCFPGTESREPRLYDVTFCAGITNENGKTFIYTGLSDCQIGRARIPYPF